jgi:hypothetical protein
LLGIVFRFGLGFALGGDSGWGKFRMVDGGPKDCGGMDSSPSGT